MSQSALIRQLKSDNPKDRFRAVKQAAKAKDDSLLKILSDIARNDPDPQVKDVAAKAVRYIKGDADFRQDSGSGRKSKTSVPVSGTNVNRARGYVEEALSYQMNNEQTKALRSMNKALNLNPNLETDPYFVSVLDEITGLSGEESKELLFDSNRQKQIAVTEKQLKKEKGMQSHLDEAHRATWASAGMDLAIYTFILIFGTMFTILLMSQGASNLMPGYDAAVAAYYQAVADGDNKAEIPQPPAPEAIMMSDAINQMGLGIGVGIIAGLIVGISGVIGLIIQLGMVHVVARYLFQGQGTLPYLIYKVVSFYNSRMVIMFLLIMAAFYTLVTSGPSTAVMVLLGAISLFNLYISFVVIGRVGQTYDFGFVMGCLSMFIAGIAVSIISSIPGWLVAGSLMSSAFAEALLASGGM